MGAQGYGLNENNLVKFNYLLIVKHLNYFSGVKLFHHETFAKVAAVS
jgi:hypothetical protein